MTRTATITLSEPNLTSIQTGKVGERLINVNTIRPVLQDIDRSPQPQSGVDLEKNLEPRRRFEPLWNDLIILNSCHLSSVFISFPPVAWRHHTSCFIAAPLTLCASQCNTYDTLFRGQTQRNPKNATAEQGRRTISSEPPAL